MWEQSDNATSAWTRPGCEHMVADSTVPSISYTSSTANAPQAQYVRVRFLGWDETGKT